MGKEKNSTLNVCNKVKTTEDINKWLKQKKKKKKKKKHTTKIGVE